MNCHPHTFNNLPTQTYSLHNNISHACPLAWVLWAWHAPVQICPPWVCYFDLLKWSISYRNTSLGSNTINRKDWQLITWIPSTVDLAGTLLTAARTWTACSTSTPETDPSSCSGAWTERRTPGTTSQLLPQSSVSCSNKGITEFSLCQNWEYL